MVFVLYTPIKNKNHAFQRTRFSGDQDENHPSFHHSHQEYAEIVTNYIKLVGKQFTA
jgi:hypothetical protein